MAFLGVRGDLETGGRLFFFFWGGGGVQIESQLELWAPFFLQLLFRKDSLLD